MLNSPMPTKPTPRSELELELTALDTLLADRQSDWWDKFYADRTKPVPFFGSDPDESLIEWVGDGTIPPGRALDIGCGNGRNAILLAKSGFKTEALDYSQAAVEWAAQRAREAVVTIQLQQANVFAANLQPAGYDLICDSGCFHHLPPHRRESYVRLVAAALKPGAWLALTCFRPEGGSGLSDDQVYERGTLGGGLGYTEARLREIWGTSLQIRELRQMRPQAPTSGRFGASFLWALLAQKP